MKLLYVRSFSMYRKNAIIKIIQIIRKLFFTPLIVFITVPNLQLDDKLDAPFKPVCDKRSDSQ